MRYLMKQRLIADGNDFSIENEDGDCIFWMDGRSVRVRQRISFYDRADKELAYVRDRLVAIRSALSVYREHSVAMMVECSRGSPSRNQFTLSITDAAKLRAQGDVMNYEYVIWRDDNKVATISKQWFSTDSTYGVDIQPDQDDILILIGTALIDVMVRSI